MGKIQLLSEQIANQIAAGEVVERPSSVVKELVENAIDAGSTRIDISIEEGGLQLIRVTDNGSGMEAEDSEVAFQRHATSKISTNKDLFSIRTLGFRGEALPSIASVSRLECVTSAESTGLGRKMVMEGGTIRLVEETAAPRGTEVTVRDLFFNTPARLKYMKTIQTELGHVSDFIYRLALAHPNVAFSLKHNGNLLLQTLGKGDLLQVIAAIYGSAVGKQMLPLEAESLDYQISGYIAKPEMTRANRGGISTIVNGRYVRNFALNQALLQGYHTLLPIHRYPIVVLQINMDPELVDVNVHPAKLEVRFSKEAELTALITAEVRRVLGKQVLIPQGNKQSAPKGVYIQEQFELIRRADPEEAGTNEAADAEATADKQSALEPQSQPQSQPLPGDKLPEENLPEEGLPKKEWTKQEIVKEEAPIDVPHSNTLQAKPLQVDQLQTNQSQQRQQSQSNQSQQRQQSQSNQSQQVKESLSAYPDGTFASSTVSSNRQQTTRQQSTQTSSQSYDSGRPKPTFQQQRQIAGNFMETLPHSTSAETQGLPSFPSLTPIGQMHGTYLIAQNNEGLFLIDQHAAHERIHYEYYYERFGNPVEASQELLVPITLEFTPSEALAIRERFALFEQAGVYLEAFGGNTFLVRAHPHWFPDGEEKQIIEEMCDWILSERKAVDIAKLREKSAILCSCKASIKANQSLGIQEMETLLDRLAACRNPYTCPHGRPIVISFSTYELEKMFKRVM
ncbi:DNA mismatch repair endonuclease MutL [Paenibacillus eucommiae]|uniref:DNA mismatch repair protein MutL n=1 Tax=Paenibacillus eucommiae TaxID=1355755 RepID=A0ABS4J7H6_9BACL|nr:DNA mismatch repair endonuclease MutL [Paenibacillus eucommiae]MBP1995191.1 DNA mismatch repair protein MutL [Paenibacillus eucommiae]